MGHALGIAGDQHRLRRVRRRGSLDVLEEAVGLATQPVHAGQARGVDEQGEHIVDDSAHSLVTGLDRRATGKRAGQELGHDRQRVALVTSERAQRSAERVRVHHARIQCRLPLGVDQRAFGSGLALVARDPDLAHRDLAGGHVEQDRRLAIGRGERDADRVGDEPRVGPAVRGHGRAMIGDVHEVQRQRP